MKGKRLLYSLTILVGLFPSGLWAPRAGSTEDLPCVRSLPDRKSHQWNRKLAIERSVSPLASPASTTCPFNTPITKIAAAAMLAPPVIKNCITTASLGSIARGWRFLLSRLQPGSLRGFQLGDSLLECRDDGSVFPVRFTLLVELVPEVLDPIL